MNDTSKNIIMPLLALLEMGKITLTELSYFIATYSDRDEKTTENITEMSISAKCGYISIKHFRHENGKNEIVWETYIDTTYDDSSISIGKKMVEIRTPQQTISVNIKEIDKIFIF